VEGECGRAPTLRRGLNDENGRASYSSQSIFSLHKKNHTLDGKKKRKDGLLVPRSLTRTLVRKPRRPVCSKGFGGGGGGRREDLIKARFREVLDTTEGRREVSIQGKGPAVGRLVSLEGRVRREKR